MKDRDYMGQLIAGYVLAPLFVLGGLALTLGLLAGTPGMVGVLLLFALPVAYLSSLFIGWPLLAHLWANGKFTRRKVLRAAVLTSLPIPVLITLGKPPGTLLELLSLLPYFALFCGIGWAIGAVFWSVGIDGNEKFTSPGAAPDAMPAPSPGSAPLPPTPAE
jgi:hypothetical protein